MKNVHWKLHDIYDQYNPFKRIITRIVETFQRTSWMNDQWAEKTFQSLKNIRENFIEKYKLFINPCPFGSMNGRVNSNNSDG